MDSIDKAYPGSDSTIETPKKIKQESPKRRWKAILDKFSIRCLAFYTMILLLVGLFLCLIASFAMIYFGSSKSGEDFS